MELTQPVQRRMAARSSPRRKCFSTETISLPAKLTAKTGKTSAKQSHLFLTNNKIVAHDIGLNVSRCFFPPDAAGTKNLSGIFQGVASAWKMPIGGVGS
jgi:hypothetical protein